MSHIVSETEASSSEGAPSEPLHGWALIKAALAGGRRDLTSLSLGQSIFLLAVPMVLEMVMESVFAVVDIFWVSKLGPAAIATVGLTESMLSIIYAVAMGLSMGATAMVARRIGEKDESGAARAAVQAIFVGLALAAVIGLSGAALAPHLLRAMGASDDVLSVGVNYTRVMLGGSASILLLFLINAAFRGAGDAVVAMRSLWLANAINIVLGPLLVFGVGPFPKLGVAGAAIATTIGRSIGVLYQLRCLVRPGGHLQVKREHVRVELDVMKAIFRISASGVVQVFIGTASWVGLVRLLAGFGSAALAGYTVAIRLVMFALLPAWGLANAAATLVGQNLGAGKPERAEQAVWKAAFANLVVLGGIGALFVVFSTNIVSIFTHEPEVVAFGSRCLRIVSAGDTRTPTLLNIVCFWLVEIPVAYVLAYPLGVGPSGVFTSILVAFSLIAVLSIALFRKGKWKAVKL